MVDAYKVQMVYEPQKANNTKLFRVLSVLRGEKKN